MVFQNNLLAGASGVTGTAPFDTTLIGNSAWFNGTDSRMDSPSFSAQSDATCFTFATWIQINAFSISNGQYIWSAERSGNYASISINSSNKLVAYSNPASFTSDMVFRDVGWYHIICSYKGAANTVRMFVNGVEISNTRSNSLATNPEPVHAAHTHRIGSYYVGATGGDLYEANSYLAQTVFLDGFSFQDGDISVSDFLDTFTFGTNGSQFTPKKDSELATLAGTAGANSYVLDYADGDSLGNDISSKDNNFTLTNLSSANKTLHTPSLSYPIFNALCPQFTDGGTWSEGNTKMVSTSESTSAITTLPPISTGKYYFQWVFTDNASSGNCNVGMSAISKWNGKQIDNAYTGETFFADHRNSSFYKGSTAVTGILGASGTYALCFDLDAGKAWVGLVDTSDGSIDWYNSSGGTTGDPANGTNPTATFTANTSMVPFTNMGKAAGTSWTVDWNFGQFGFGNSAVPTGFEQITSAKVAAPDYQGIDYFDATLYEGNGTGQRVGDFVPFTDAYTVDNSAIFEHDDARYLSRTIEAPSAAPSVAKKGTWSIWFKTANIDTDCVFFDTGTTATNRFSLQMDASGQIVFSHGGTTILKTGAPSQTADFKGDGAWHNVVLKVDTDQGTASNRAAMFIDGVEQTAFETDARASLPEDAEIGYMDENATQFVGSYNGATDNQWDGYLAEAVFLDNQFENASSFGQLDTATNRWVPKSVSGLTFGNCGFYLEFETAPNLGTLIAQGTGTPIGNMTAGGGLAAAFDGDIENYNAGAQANATSGNLGKDWGSGVTKTITGVVVKMLGNVTIDGGAAAETMTLTVERSANGTDFTTVYTESGISVAAGAIVTRRDGFTNTAAARYARVSVSHGGGAETHISELEFYEGGTSGIGTDSSGNSNNFTQGGSWAASDQSTDTPSKNYPIVVDKTISGKTYSEGNLKVTSSSGFGQGNVLTTLSMPLQKGGYWYWEIIDAAASANQTYGIAKADAQASANGLGNDTKSWAFYNNQYRHGGNVGAVPDSPTNTGTRYMFAVDVDEGKFWMGNDGTWWKPVGGSTAGNPAAGTNPAFIDGDIANGDTFPAMDLWSSDSATFVFDQSDFAHSAPTGFSELNQDNLDDTASKITAWAWIKNRDAGDNHILVDRVRGVGKDLHSNDGSAEATNSNTVQRFLQRGVQIGSDVEVNTANESYVLWQWLLGDSATTGSSITTGSPSLTTTGIVADADHFSIISYTGSGSNATVAHGLSAAPEMYWVRDRTDGNDWNVYVDGANASPASGSLRLDSSAAFNPDGTIWNGVPTASLINLGTSDETNELNKNFIAYCFRSIPGVCKVGSYVGNGDDNGSYISLGFRPRWILLKSTTTARDWPIFDTARDPINLADQRLDSSTNATEFAAALDVDFLADGWKFRSDDIDGNASGVTYIYLAMADIGGGGTLPPIYGR